MGGSPANPHYSVRQTGRLIVCTTFAGLALILLIGCPSGTATTAPPDNSSSTRSTPTTPDAGAADETTPRPSASDPGDGDGTPSGSSGQPTADDPAGADGQDGASTPEEEQPPPLPAGSVQSAVSAAAGGTLTSDTGVTLEVPPGVLEEDTELTMIPLPPDVLQQLDPQAVAVIHLEPEGLVFDTPVTLHVPLAEEWTDDEPPVVLYYAGVDPHNAIPAGTFAELSADRRTATLEIQHFCGHILARNCYSGALEYLNAVWPATHSDYDLAKVAARVHGKFPNVTIPDDIQKLTDRSHSLQSREIQALADTFFEEVPEQSAFAPGEPIPYDLLDQMVAWRSADRNVMIIFAPSIQPRAGDEQFRRGLAHVGVVDDYQGHPWEQEENFFANGVGYVPHGWTLRHSFPFAGSGTGTFLQGTNLAYWPLRKAVPSSAVWIEDQDLNSFREALQYVAYEAYKCGQPGCGVQQPGAVAQFILDWTGAWYGGEPDATLPYPPLDKRGQTAWRGAYLFVERADSNPCNRLTGCWEIALNYGEETARMLLRVNQEGHLDSMWIGAVALEDDDLEVPDLVYIELMRFTAERPNMPAMAESLRNVNEQIVLSDDQATFTMTFGWETWDDDDQGGQRISSKTTYKITGGKMSQNTPEEYFTAAYEQTDTDYSYDDEGVQTVTTDEPLVLEIRGERVACPDPEKGTGITQEYFIEHLEEVLGEYLIEGFESFFASLASLCGAGFVGFMPFTLAGLAGLKIAVGRARR